MIVAEPEPEPESDAVDDGFVETRRQEAVDS